MLIQGKRISRSHRNEKLVVSICLQGRFSLSVAVNRQLTEIVVHAEVRHELLEDVERIVKMKGSIEKVFGEARIAAVRRMTRIAVIIRQASSAQLIVFATFVF